MKIERVVKTAFAIAISLSFQINWMALPTYASASPVRIEAQKAEPHNNPSGNLTPRASEIAKLMGIQQYIERLIAMKKANPLTPGTLPDEERLALEMYILERIVGASLEVRTVADEIDEELAYSYDVRAVLTSKRDRNVNMDFIANFMQGGTLATISGPLFLDKQPLAANLCLLTASGTSILLSTLALKLQSGGKRKCDSSTNMLAHYLDLNPPEQNQFPPLVWGYVNAMPQGQTESRRQRTMAHWKKMHKLDMQNTDQLYKLSALKKPGEETQYDNIGLLTRRIYMLHYVHADVESLDGALLELIRAVDMYP